MLTERVREVVNAAKPREQVALIFSVTARPQMDEVKRLDFPDRRAFVNAFYAKEKAEVLGDLNALQRFGLRIVDPLIGTPKIVAAASASDWTEMFRNETVFGRPELQISTNDVPVMLP